MNFSDTPPNGSASQMALSALRRFANRPRRSQERCDLCAADLAVEHSHLLEVGNRQIMCACEACALLFSNGRQKLLRIPRDVFYWGDLAMTDDQWAGLGVPISLAFFFHSTPFNQIVAIYPSPAGPTETTIPAEAWQGLADANQALSSMRPDVEALLVNRVGGARDYYRAPIDQCFKLVGLVRLHWRGLSGGTEVWKHIAAFFEDLNARAQTLSAHA